MAFILFREILTKMPDIYLTGFSGQIGSKVREYANSENIKLNLLGRDKPELKPNEQFIYFNLNGQFNLQKVNKDSVIFHLAHDFSRDAGENNFISTKLLVTGLRKKGCKFVFTSTPLNQQGNMSHYQATKLKIDSLFDLEKDLIIKPSLVYSEQNGVNKVFKFLKDLKIPIPLPPIKNKIAPVCAKDLGKFILKSKLNLNLSGKILVVGAERMLFSKFLLTHHNLKNFYLPLVFFKILTSLLTLLPLNSAFYFKERIHGLLNIPDLDQEANKERVFIL